MVTAVMCVGLSIMGLLCRVILLQSDKVAKYEQAIRLHRDWRGDNRCWLDDEVLYNTLPEGYDPPQRGEAVELEACKKFIKCRHNPGTLYISPQDRIKELELECAHLRDLCIELTDPNAGEETERGPKLVFPATMPSE